MSLDTWKADLVKMRNAVGAPIDEADAAKILAYLTAPYGARQ